MVALDPSPTNDLVHQLAEQLKARKITYLELIDGTGVVLGVDGVTALKLNRSGMLLLKTIEEGAQDIESLATALAGKYRLERETALRDTLTLLDQLRGAVDSPEEPSRSHQD